MQDSHIQNSLDQEYRDFFELATESRECVDKLLQQFNKRETKLFDLPACQRILLFILTRSIKTYSSIIILCKLGYGQDVATLLRGLLENLITAEYILHNPKTANQLAERFVAYKWVIFKRTLPEQEKEVKTESKNKKQEFYKRKALVLKNVEDFKKKFSVTSDRALLTWSGKTVRDMARGVSSDLLADYELTFRQCSKFSHPSILGDQEYMIQDDKSLIFSALPSRIGVIFNLTQAVKYFLSFAELIGREFQLSGKEKELKFKYASLCQLLEESEPSLRMKSTQEIPPIRECTIVFKTHQ